jgi:hypothetical protein
MTDHIPGATRLYSTTRSNLIDFDSESSANVVTPTCDGFWRLPVPRSHFIMIKLSSLRFSLAPERVQLILFSLGLMNVSLNFEILSKHDHWQNNV